ncbi:response regulator [Pseudomonas oryzihabitans]|uniref:response regulator n=1 Tax=Pseudomonas oryzihabitans TaxID=47885 RepID=UPI00241C23C8|nr:response regulator [Pseudomonas oryzihabitans]
MLNLSSFQVVIVEDDALLGGILEEMLVERGANTVSYSSADEALLGLLQTDKPDLLITDHLVPGQLKGADLAELILNRWPELPTIVTTGYGYGISDCLPARVVYLQKPWSIEAMEDAIRQSLQ